MLKLKHYKSMDLSHLVTNGIIGNLLELIEYLNNILPILDVLRLLKERLRLQKKKKKKKKGKKTIYRLLVKDLTTEKLPMSMEELWRRHT